MRLDIQTSVFGNQLAKEYNTWTNARAIVRTNFVEVYGEAMQVLQPLNFFTPRLEYFWTLKVKASKFLLAFFGRGAQCKVPDFSAINNPCICFC